MSPVQLDAELAAFIESGVFILVGSRNAQLMPDSCDGCGARAEPGGREVTVFLPVATAASVVADLSANGRIAVNFGRLSDDHCVQLKGQVTAVAEAAEEDHTHLLAYHREMLQVYAMAGAPPVLSDRIVFWPAWAIRFRLESMFLQTPGPGAGEPLGTNSTVARENGR